MTILWSSPRWLETLCKPPWLSPSGIFGWWYGWKDPQERHAVSFFPNSPVLQGKAVFGLKTQWLYHQPEPWMKSLPLKLNKQPGLHSHSALGSWDPFGSWTQLSDFTFTFHFHALEKEMATHSSVLAWRAPGTAEPGGLLSMGSHRVGQD